MRACLYARVSSRDQKSIPDQLSDLRQYCSKQGWEIVAEWSDTITGKSATRPERNKLLKQMYKGRYDVILVWKLDRWSRSTVDSVNTLAEMERVNVGFVSLYEKLDFTTPMGRAMVRILAVFAELERETIIERINAGIKKYREKNPEKHWGRPSKRRQYRVLIEERIDRGLSDSAIARELKISRMTVMRVRQNGGPKK